MRMTRSARFLVRLDLMRRPVAVIVLTVVVAMLFGGAVASAIGARRSATAMDRFLAFTRPSSLSVAGAPSTMAAVDKLPGIASSVGGAYLGMAPADASGEPQVDLLGSINPIVERSYVGGTDQMQRVRLLKGRMPDPSRPLEVLIDEQVASERGLDVGGTLRMIGFLPEQVDDGLTTGGVAPRPRGADVALQVVGIQRSVTDVDAAEPAPEVVYLGTADVLMNGSFLDAYGDRVVSLGPPGFDFREIRLVGGAAAVPAFEKAVRALPGGGDVEVSTTFDSVVAAGSTKRAITVETLGLWALAAAFLLASLLVAVPGIGRLSRRSVEDLSVARTLGQTPSETAAAAATPGLVVALGAPLLGVVIGYLASPLTPIGLGREAEIEPGLRFDPVIALPSALALAVVLCAVVVLTAGRVAAAIRGSSHAGGGRVRITRLRWRGPLAGVLGIGVTGRRGSAAPVPLRSTALMLGVALLVGAGVASYTASLNSLIATPSDQGWMWDLRVGNPNNVYPPGTEKRLLDDPVIDGVAAVAEPGTEVLVDGVRTEVGAFVPVRGDLSPALREGSLPAGTDEVVLGTRTMDRLGVKLGDQVQIEVGTQKRAMRVVGSGVLSEAISKHFTMGEGAILDYKLLSDAVGAEGSDAGYTGFLVSLKPGIDSAAAAVHLQDAWGRSILTPRTPIAVVNLARVRSLPVAFSLVLLAVAVMLLGWTLFAGVRRRSSDLLLFAALGSTRGSLAGSIVWQTVWMVGWAIVVGVPLGLVLGRIAWTNVADGLGTFAPALMPGPLAWWALGAVVLVAALVTFPPAWSASRVSAAIPNRRD